MSTHILERVYTLSHNHRFFIEGAQLMYASVHPYIHICKHEYEFYTIVLCMHAYIGWMDGWMDVHIVYLAT